MFIFTDLWLVTRVYPQTVGYTLVQHVDWRTASSAWMARHGSNFVLKIDPSIFAQPLPDPNIDQYGLQLTCSTLLAPHVHALALMFCYETGQLYHRIMLAGHKINLGIEHLGGRAVRHEKAARETPSITTHCLWVSRVMISLHTCRNR